MNRLDVIDRELEVLRAVIDPPHIKQAVEEIVRHLGDQFKGYAESIIAITFPGTGWFFFRSSNGRRGVTVIMASPGGIRRLQVWIRAANTDSIFPTAPCLAYKIFG